jgi:hypothetical protein
MRPCSLHSLLQFLTGLSENNGLAASWQNDNTDCCKWEGITSSGNSAMVEVSLAFRGLQGCISSSLGDLNNLQSLNLSYNSFTGSLPSERLASSSIVVLDVSFNQLSRVLQPQESNSSVTNIRPLHVLNISSNLFTGEFPYAVWEKTSSLVVLNASNNNFQGLMPSSFCTSSLSFVVLDLTHNNFNDNIPAGIGKCSALRVLKAGVGGSEKSDEIPEHKSIGTMRFNIQLAKDRETESPKDCSRLKSCEPLYTCPCAPFYRETKRLFTFRNYPRI